MKLRQLIIQVLATIGVMILLAPAIIYWKLTEKKETL